MATKKNTSKGRKPAKPESPATLIWDRSVELSARESLIQFFEILTFAGAYGTPQYSELEAPARTKFEQLVEYGLLFEYIERAKQDLLRAGVKVPDAWLGELCAGSIKPGKGLDEEDRQRIIAIARQVWVTMYRHDAGQEEIASCVVKNKSKRPAYARDHLWLTWHKDGANRGEIRDRWRAMSPADRQPYTPADAMIGKGKAGWQIVDKALRRAKAEAET